MDDPSPYIIELSDTAIENLRHLDQPIAQRIGKKLKWLAENASSLTHDALTGQLSGYYRIRIGDYRAIYRMEHDNRLIVVERLGHRRDIYKR